MWKNNIPATPPHAIYVCVLVSPTQQGGHYQVSVVHVSLCLSARQSKNLENLINENIFKQLHLYSIWPING